MKRGTLIICILLFAVLTVLAAFISTDNFDSYSVSSELNGASGGTNWTGNWTGTNGQWTAETAPAGGQGGNAARNQAAAAFMSRTFTATSEATLSFRMRLSITNPNDFTGVFLAEGGTGIGRMYVRFGPTGNIEIFDNVSAYVTIQAYSANTWYTIDINFDDAAVPNEYRARVDGGTWSGYKVVNGSTYTVIDYFVLDASDSGTRDFWVDDIRPTGFPQYYYRMMRQP